MATVTLKLAPDVLEKARIEATNEKRSLSKQVELWIEQATQDITITRKRKGVVKTK